MVAPAPAAPTAPVAPALASSYATGTGPASFGVGVPAAAGGLGNSYGTPPPAPAVANPYQQYIDAFNASQTRQRGAIDTMLHQSLGELQGRRDAAAQVVAGLPGEVAAAYNQSSGGLQGGVNAATGALSPDVNGTAAALAAPLQGALKQDAAGANSLGPFLQLAMRANADSGQNALENSAFNANAGLEQQNQQFQQSLLMQQAQAAQQRSWATDPQNPDSLAGRTQLATQQNKAAIDAQPTSEAALQGTGLTTGEVTQLRASPEYARFVGMINSAKADKHAGNGVMISNELAVRNPKLLALLVKENPDFFANAKLPGMANPNAGFAAANDLHGTVLGNALGFGGHS